MAWHFYGGPSKGSDLEGLTIMHMKHYDALGGHNYESTSLRPKYARVCIAAYMTAQVLFDMHPKLLANSIFYLLSIAATLGKPRQPTAAIIVYLYLFIYVALS